MKTIRILSLTLVLVFALCTFASCGQSLIGTWKNESGTISFTFEKDGTGKMTLESVGAGVNIRYTAEKGKLTVYYTVIVELSAEYEYKISGDTLTLSRTSGGTTVSYELTKQK